MPDPTFALTQPVLIGNAVRVGQDGYATVMATGIIAVAAEDRNYQLLSLALGALASAVFVLSGVVAATIAWRHRARLRDSGALLAAFTCVAACNVLAVRWRTGPPAISWALAAVAAAVWAAAMTGVPRVLHRRSFTAPREQACGSWLLASVAIQSLAVVAALLAHRAAPRALSALAVTSWVLGLACYLVVVRLMIARAIVERRVPRGPDNWILMGALAIAALAASSIAASARPVPGLGWLAALTSAATWALWALASAWIPVLLGIQVRCLVRSLLSEPARWTAVFPIGMYSAATSGLAGMHPQLGALRAVALVALVSALVLWAVATVGQVANSSYSDILALRCIARGR